MEKAYTNLYKVERSGWYVYYVHGQTPQEAIEKLRSRIKNFECKHISKIETIDYGVTVVGDVSVTHH